jgi:hypothetical protein
VTIDAEKVTDESQLIKCPLPFGAELYHFAQFGQ